MTENQYNQNNPFLATIKERYPLSKEGSKKDTQHIIIDFEGSGITYEPGDSIGIIPWNYDEVVDLTIEAMQATGNEIIVDKRTQKEKKLRDALKNDLNINKLTKNLLKLIQEKTEDSKLEKLLQPENKEELNDYIANRALWDCLKEFPGVKIPPQEICDKLTRMIPRLYSIASSMKVLGNAAQLIVAVVTYNTNDQHRYGVCSNYIGHWAPINEPCIPMYIHNNKQFKLPEDPNTPIIMVGPGTGVAPFHAFVQERLASNAPGKNWLFFGDWTRKNDYFYGEYWDQLEKEGKLRLNVAFSRDQDYKIYVQNKMYENAADVWQWLSEGAHLYVCGDASRMAKDVDATLHKIIEEHGNTNPQEYVKQMRKDKRYLRDVY